MTDTQPKSDDCRTAVELALWKALKIAREERDEARREVCALFVAGDFSVHENVTKDHVAFERGWDCFKEQP